YKKRLGEELDAQVRQARKDIDEVIAELKAKSAAFASAPRLVSTGETGGARTDARAAVDEVARRALAGETSPDSVAASVSSVPSQSAIRNPPSAMSEVAVGDRVIVGGLGLEAVVTSVHDGTAELDVRGKRMRASVRDLRVIAGGNARGHVHVNIVGAVREPQLRGRDGTVDLNVIGCTVDEAISRAERFLDGALTTD